MRRLVVLMAVLCIGASCGGGGGGSKDDDNNGEYGSDLLTGTRATVAPPSTNTPTTKAGTATTTRRPTGTLRPNAPKLGEAPATPSNPYAGAKKGPGEFAGALLTPLPAKRLVFELQSQEGAGPRQAALDHLLAVLKRVTAGKQIEFTRVALPAGPLDWTPDTLQHYADQFAKTKSGGDTAVVYIQYVHGKLNSSAYAAGHRGDVISMFVDTYKNAGGFRMTVDEFEKGVVTHEVGHILGLVDLWLNTGRGDYKNDPAPGGHHSPNKRSVMYYAGDNTDLAIVFSGGTPPTDYDSEDNADLAAIRGGAPFGSKRP